MSNDKLNHLLKIYKQYKALSEYIDKEYKLTLNDLALLKLAYEYTADDQILMQEFLKIAIEELELSRTKLLVSIRRLIEKEKLSKVRSTEDERKIFIYMNKSNIDQFHALFNDVERFLSN
ncbi:MarR family transcriptional regulator [Staphylococcus hominis]